MLLKFYCANKNCSNKYSRPYILNISSADLHENEIAEPFCPRCKRKLMRKIRMGKFDGFFLKHTMGGRHVHQAIHDQKDHLYR